MSGTRPAKTTPVPTLGVPTPPPLPEDLQALLHRLRLPHIRRHAPEVVATAKAQRWEPVEVLRALFTEEAAGRERSALATRRAAAGFPTGKTFEAWSPAASSILDHHATGPARGEHRASEDSSLTQGTSAWARLGQQVGQHDGHDGNEVAR